VRGYLTSLDNQVVGDPNPDFQKIVLPIPLNIKTLSLQAQLDWKEGGGHFLFRNCSLIR